MSGPDSGEPPGTFHQRVTYVLEMYQERQCERWVGQGG